MSTWSSELHPRSDSGKFTNSDAQRDDPGQVSTVWGESNPGSDNAIGDTVVSSKVFHHPDGDVKVSVYRWVEATTGGVPFTPAEHAAAAYESYGEDAEGTEPVPGIEYQVAEAVTIEAHGNTETKYGSSVYGTESPAAGLADIASDEVDWDDFYDPDDYNRDIELGLKGGLDLPRFSHTGSVEPVVKAWANGVSTSLDGQFHHRLDGDTWEVQGHHNVLRVEARGTSLTHSMLAEAANARAVETTWHSDDWGDDDEYIEAVSRAHRLREWMGEDAYEMVICRGETSTLAD